VFTGKFNLGLRDGFGTLREKGEASIVGYVGNWSNDQKHGHGIVTYENGD